MISKCKTKKVFVVEQVLPISTIIICMDGIIGKVWRTEWTINKYADVRVINIDPP